MNALFGSRPFFSGGSYAAKWKGTGFVRPEGFQGLMAPSSHFKAMSPLTLNPLLQSSSEFGIRNKSDLFSFLHRRRAPRIKVKRPKRNPSAPFIKTNYVSKK